MEGRRSGVVAALRADAVRVAEATLVVLSVAGFGAIESDGAWPGWLPVLFPVLLAVTVLAHRSSALRRGVRAPGAVSPVRLLVVGVEVVLAAGLLLALLSAGVIGTFSAVGAGSFDAASSGLAFALTSGILAGFFALFLVMAVGGRLVIGGLLRLARRRSDG